jgi:hypothetical protein
MAVKNKATSIATQDKSMRRNSEGEFAGPLLIEALDSNSLDRAITLASESGDIAPNSFVSYDLVFVCTARQ